MTDLLLFGLAPASVIVGASFQRLTGMGFAAVSAPVLVSLWGPAVGVQVVNLTAAVCSLLLLAQLWRDVDLRRTLLIAVAATVTTPVGVLLVMTLPAAVLQFVLGAVMLTALFGVRALMRTRIVRGRPGILVSGALAGVSNATVGQAGPVMGALALASQWKLSSYVASMQLCWFIVNAVAVAIRGVPPIEPWALAALCASVVAGVVVGAIVSRAVPPRLAERILFVVALMGAALVFGTGVASLIAG